ncbi:ABC transporter substrate-binding protein [Desulfosarcina ovata]|uniref:ABC transporter substrate-binding protein n=1 Tax=Desulfosarcina ovata TaxID=83564 RepID=UPI0012D2A87C|nr:cobalamin-binding protein [Desulfosarcina ovata]
MTNPCNPRHPDTPDRPRRPAIRLIRFGQCVLSALLLTALLTSWSAAGTVADRLGRQVRLPDHPRRIVSLAPSITEILFALDLSGRLVGVTQFSDFPPAAATLPKVGSYVHLDVERIVALAPDLCIAIKDGNPVSVVNKLESIGIPVYAVDPRDLPSVMETLSELGRVLDVHPRATQIVTGMRQRIDWVHQQVATADRRPGVFFQIGIAPIVSAGTNTFIHELITMAGGINLAQGPVPYPRFSKEEVIGLRPEIMIITSMARRAVFEQVKRDWQQWQAIPAVKNDRIYIVDSNVLDRPTPRLVEGLEQLARLIHPDVFKAAPRKPQP